MCRISPVVMAAGSDGSVYADAAGGPSPGRLELRLVYPRDPLTRLMMEADGVTDAAMDELLGLVVKN